MNIKHFSILFILSFLACNLKADPGTYYNSTDTGKTCAALKTALFNLILNDNHLNYGDIDNNYNRTDIKPNENGSGFVIADRYCSENPTGLDFCSFDYITGFCSSGGTASTYCECYNKEHALPASWFNGTSSTNIVPRTDMHSVWPADSKTNGYKSNYPLGYVKTTDQTSLNGTKIGTSDPAKNFGYYGTGSKVFEPIDSFKGDFARAYLYFVTRYQDSISAWRKYSTSDSVFSETSYTGLDPWILQLCVKWHKLDPPSAFERKRNDSVFAIQRNRNPYIDYPHWVEKTFGVDGNAAGCISSGIRNYKTVEFSLFPNPVKNGILNFKTKGFINEEAYVEVIDITGRKLIVQKINFTGSSGIDVSHIANGIYFLNIFYKEANNVLTFIKE